MDHDTGTTELNNKKQWTSNNELIRKMNKSKKKEKEERENRAKRQREKG